MAQLLKAVNTVHELKRREFIEQLKKLGVYEVDRVPIDEMNYYQLRHILVLVRIRREQ